jgi:hypothetical protein
MLSSGDLSTPPLHCTEGKEKWREERREESVEKGREAEGKREKGGERRRETIE